LFRTFSTVMSSSDKSKYPYHCLKGKRSSFTLDYGVHWGFSQVAFFMWRKLLLSVVYWVFFKSWNRVGFCQTHQLSWSLIIWGFLPSSVNVRYYIDCCNFPCIHEDGSNWFWCMLLLTCCHIFF
jgi:hypothetical protein